jgi:phage-related minor tail protein
MAAEIFKLVGRITYEGQQKVEAGLNALGKKIEATQQKLTEFGERAQAAGEKTTAIGEGLTKYVTAPLAGLGLAAGLAANDTQRAMGRIQAGLGTTEEHARELTKEAQTLWKNGFGENVTEAAESIGEVSRNLGSLVDDAQLTKITEQAYIFRDAFGYDIAESSRTAATLITQFGVEGTKAMDYLTAATQAGGDYSKELLDVVNEYSPQFKAAGMNIDQMFNTLLNGAYAGAFNMDKVGDAVKEFNIRAKDGSDTTAEGFKAIGLNATQMGAAIAGGGEKGAAAFQATIAALANMKDPVKQAQAGVALFGTQWEDLEADVITSMTGAGDALGDVSGATQKAGDALYNNFGARLETTMRKAQAALEPVGQKMLDVADRVLPPLLGGVEKLSTWFSNLGNSGQNTVLIIGAIAAAAGPLLIIVGTLITSIGAIAGVLGAVTAPVWGIIAGIAALVAIFAIAYAKSETFRNAVNNIGLKLKEVFLTGFGVVAAFLQTKLAELSAWWSQNSAMIMGALQNIANVVTGVFSVVWPIALALIRATWGYIQNIINGALNIITGAIQFFAALFTGNWSALWAAIGRILSGAVELIWGLVNISLVGRLLGGFRSLASAAGSTIKNMASSIVGFFRGLASGAVNTVTSMKNRVVSYFTGLWNQARTIFSILRQYGESIFRALGNTITSVAGNIRAQVVSRFNSLLSSARSIFNNIKTAITNPVTTAQNAIKTATDKIKGFFTKMKLKFPKIDMPKLPHFSLKGKFSLKPPSVPTIGVNWYAKGGVFDGDSIIGVGEKGPEAVVPLTGPRMKPFAETIAQQMPGGAAGAMIYLENIVQLGGKEIQKMVRILSPYLDAELAFERDKNNRHKGGRRTQ